jgi:ribonuclease P protein component
MSAPQGHTLPKEERLCGKTTVSALISDGKWGATAHLRYCWAAGRSSGCNRLMVAVPKKFFKRAVKRNLLKRRLREAYRLQKELLPGPGIDLMLSYSHPEVADFATLYAEVTDILTRISSRHSDQERHSGPDPESPAEP